MSTAALNQLLDAYPDMTVDIVCGPQAAPLFAGLPNLGQLYPLYKQKHHAHYWNLWKTLRQHRYDLIVDLRTPLLARLLPSKRTVVYQRPNEKDPTHLRPHRAEQFAALGQRATGLEHPLRLSVWPAPEAAEEVAPRFKHLLATKGPLIALAPTANWRGKQWPQANWAEYLQLLDSQITPKARFVVLGAPAERPFVADMLATMPASRTVDMVGNGSLAEAVAAIGKADLFIGHDSGLGHIAAALGKPVLSLFGPSRTDLYRPYGKKVQLVVAPDRPRAEVNLEPTVPARLMTDLTPRMVLEATLEMYEHHWLNVRGAA